MRTAVTWNLQVHLSHSKSLSNHFFVWNDVHTISSQGAINPVWGRPGLCNSPSTSIQTYRGSLSLKNYGRCHGRFWIYLSSPTRNIRVPMRPAHTNASERHNRTNLADLIEIQPSMYGLSCFPPTIAIDHVNHAQNEQTSPRVGDAMLDPHRRIWYHPWF